MVDFGALREAMVDCQVRPSDVTRYGIIDAMLKVPRERFVPKTRRPIAYAGTEIDVGHGRALLEPRVLAKMLEVSAISEGDLVLELAPATGYSTAVIAHLAEAVIAIEGNETLAGQAQQAIAALEIDNAVVTAADPALGDPSHAPFDVILVNGAVGALPDGLTDQLREGGRLVAVFLESGVGKCRILTKSGSGVSERFAFDASAPLLEGFAGASAFSF